jgi:hypothetical protein
VCQGEIEFSLDGPGIQAVAENRKQTFELVNCRQVSVTIANNLMDHCPSCRHDNDFRDQPLIPSI